MDYNFHERNQDNGVNKLSENTSDHTLKVVIVLRKIMI